MSIFRNSGALATIFTIVMLVLVAPVAAVAAEKQGAGKPAETRRPVQPVVKAPVRKPSKGVFKPKEKISAGKPVSFPSDI
jgi:hypothetical protein